jgi:hypothetical protein
MAPSRVTPARIVPASSGVKTRAPHHFRPVGPSSGIRRGILTSGWTPALTRDAVIVTPW